MAIFNDDHKQEFEGKYFDQGVHKVKIQSVTLGKTQAEKEYMEFGVISEDGSKEDTVRIWFTTDGAIKYSFNTIKGIFVHNAPEAKKEVTRAAVDKIKDTEELEKACQKLIGKECWYRVYLNLQRPYTKTDGTTGYSYDKDIAGYELESRTVQKAPSNEVTVSADQPLEMPEGSSDDQPFGF